MSASEPRPVSIRRYEESDNSSLLALLQAVFGIDRSVEQWRWRFEQNPAQVHAGHNQVFATLGVDAQTGRVIAQYTVTPTFINFVGTRVLGSQSGDTAVHPDYQGYGLFIKTAVENYAMLAASDFKLVYGFPNLNSFPGFVRRLGWHRVCQLYEYSLRLRIGSLPLSPYVRMRRALEDLRLRRQFTGRSLALSVDETVPNDFDSLWKEVSAYEILSIWKDKSYLDWRYASNPATRYRFYSMREGGRLLAMAVATQVDKSLLISEIFSAKKNVGIARLLLQRITTRSFGESFQSINFTGRDDGFFDAIFTGFRRTLGSLVFCLRVFDEAQLGTRALLPGNWTTTIGDLDYL